MESPRHPPGPHRPEHRAPTRLSVIIATRNRAHAILDCLKSVAASAAAAGIADEAEIVVVDNGSSDGTAHVVESWGATRRMPVRLVTEPVAGLSRARNAGMRESRGDLLVFTDDDCRMSPTYVEELLRYDAQDQELVMRSGSVVLGDPSDLPLTIKRVDATRTWKRPMSVDGEGQLLGSLIGCNMAMRRRVVEILGPFDTRLGAGTNCPAGEDTDYFYRAYLAGIRLEMVPDLIVAHHHGRKTEAQRISLYRNYAVGNGALAAKYLLRYPNFSRHILWELRASLPRVLAPYPGVTAAGRLSPRDRLYRMFVGMFRYMIGRLGIARG